MFNVNMRWLGLTERKKVNNKNLGLKNINNHIIYQPTYSLHLLFLLHSLYQIVGGLLSKPQLAVVNVLQVLVMHLVNIF